MPETLEKESPDRGVTVRHVYVTVCVCVCVCVCVSPLMLIMDIGIQSNCALLIQVIPLRVM